MRREGRSNFGEEEKSVGGCYTSVPDVLNTVSKGRRSILAPCSIARAVKKVNHTLTSTSLRERLVLWKYSTSISLLKTIAKLKIPAKGNYSKYARRFGKEMRIFCSRLEKACSCCFKCTSHHVFLIAV